HPHRHDPEHCATAMADTRQSILPWTYTSAVTRCRLSSPNPRSTLANLNEGSIMTVVKSALRYSAEHEWLNDEDPVRIGITDYAADQLGDVVFAELPEVGDTVTAGEVCGELESTEDVIQNPERINEDPYGAGWLFTVDVSEEGPLLTPEQYAEQTEGTVE